MGFRLTIWGIAGLAAFGGAVVLSMGGSAVRAAVHALFFEKVGARVVRTYQACALKGTTAEVRADMTASLGVTNGEFVECTRVEGFAQDRGQDNVKVRKRSQADIRYPSPSDGQEHLGTIALTYDQQKTMPLPGTVLTIFAHKEDVARIEPDF